MQCETVGAEGQVWIIYISFENFDQLQTSSSLVPGTERRLVAGRRGWALALFLLVEVSSKGIQFACWETAPCWKQSAARGD